jgi:hypothetical protein
MSRDIKYIGMDVHKEAVGSKPTETQALKDAEYALRRFEEVTARIDFNRLKAPGTTIGETQQAALNMTQTLYVDEAKTILGKFEGKANLYRTFDRYV